ncbi:MAG TPA: hypothetical protein PLJ71_08430 [Candidatus Hydrogenedentes bacterium]|nr:hypothetical protein [Candidatus Hydrogenedentota bacterium]HQM48701.1 hypothetical protein [Candidatus Hydrogenedentota bacterium]
MGMVSGPLASILAGLPSAAQTPENAAGASTPGIEKAYICFRIGVPTYRNEARFQELLDLFERYRGVTDEITLFTSETHPPLPLDVMFERIALLESRMAMARARGYRTGINILSTVGHHEENLPNSLSGEFVPMTDVNGGVCRGSFCPNCEPMREYIRRVYEALAKAKPDYIWIDDDVRLFGHMPIGAACFCDTCIALFGQRAGKTFTRESLSAALSSGPVAEKLDLRRRYLQHNRETIGNLFRMIETTVHDVQPGLPLGFMTGDRFFEGYDFDTWADILSGPGRAEVMWRPGGGTYTDERMAGITDKAHDVGRQTALLPGYVKCIESELESFPYQRLKKSAHSTFLEAAAYIAGGCTGTAFNVLSMYDEPLDEYEPLVKRLRAGRPFLDVLARTLGRAPSIGLHSGWVKDTYAAQNVDGAWFGGPGAPGHCNELWSTGLPAAYTAAHATVTALSGEQVMAFTKEELQKLLSGAVYLDGPALDRLNALGYGALTGFETVEVRHEDCIEEMTNHPLNGPYAGRRRNGRQSFWKCPAYFFRPTSDGAQALSRCVDYTYTETGPCCLGVFENGSGGRVCVEGYYPWQQVQTLSKSAQVKAIMRWLSRDTLPAYVASFHRVNLWVRRPHENTMAVALLNAYMDPAEGMTLLVHTAGDVMRITDMRGAQSEVEAAGADGPYKEFVLPAIAPWEMLLAVA